MSEGPGFGAGVAVFVPAGVCSDCSRDQGAGRNGERRLD